MVRLVLTARGHASIVRSTNLDCSTGSLTIVDGDDLRGGSREQRLRGLLRFADSVISRAR